MRLFYFEYSILYDSCFLSILVLSCIKNIVKLYFNFSDYFISKLTKIIRVHDKMQQGYAYSLTEAEDDNFHPDFNPQLTPKQMLELGVFGGKYLNDCQQEYPKEWFVDAKLSVVKDIRLNYFSVDASLPLKEWVRKGWIHPQDPRGWFQWYCRYFLGRRTDEEDHRQIKRWRAFKRHVGAVKKYCEPYDHSCRRKQRQALLHWAYDAREF